MASHAGTQAAAACPLSRATCTTQASLTAKGQQAAAQAGTIRRLEATIREQQADIRAALSLVAGRPVAGAAGEEDMAEEGILPAEYGSEAAGDGMGAYGGTSGDAFDWATGSGAAAGPLGDGWGGPEHVGTGSEWTPAGELNALLNAASAAADAAAAWAGGSSYGTDAAGSYDAAAADWAIPACGAADADSWLPGGGSSARCSPAKPAPLGLASASAAVSGKRHVPATQPVQGSDGAASASLGSLEEDIEGLEAALRSALGDLQV